MYPRSKMVAAFTPWKSLLCSMRENHTLHVTLLRGARQRGNRYVVAPRLP